ncbi:MAG: hypothetical protein ACO3JL_01585, partial [Myxococcota bacterium]
MRTRRLLARGAIEVPAAGTDVVGERRRQLPGLVVVAFAVLASVATSREPVTGGPEVCGPLAGGASASEGCSLREDCAEVCCLCDDGTYSYVARGCDLDGNVCYDEATLCQL